MIRTRQDLRHFLEQDRLQLRIRKNLVNYLFHDIWRFQRVLRRAEYWHNNRNRALGRIMDYWCQFQLLRKGRALGYSIPVNVFGPGLAIAHAGTIVVNRNTRVGRNCRLHVCVNIGADVSDGTQAPTIGDDCYIGPGVKIFGAVEIGSNTGMGANAVINKSFPEGNQTLAGVPAKVISDQGPLQYRPLEKVPLVDGGV